MTSNEGHAPRLSVAALAVVSEGVATLSVDGTITHANEAFCRLLRTDASALVGRHLWTAPWLLEDADGNVVPAVESPVARVLRALAAPTPDTPTVVVEELVLVSPDGTSHRVRVGAGPADPDDPSAGAVMSLSDVTAIADAERHLQHLMFTDSLTSLASRDRVIERLAGALTRATGAGGRVGVLHVDLDGFRTVNDTFGTTVGDAVLVEVANRLRDLAEQHVVVGRVGVDEFLLMVEGGGVMLEFDSRMRTLADEVQRRISRPILHDGLELHLTASIGAARSPEDARSSVELIAAADRALRTSRSRGRNQFHLHDVTIDIRNRSHQLVDRDLRLATARRELEVYYQPIVDLRRGTLASAEALARWNHPERGPVSPAVFIPAAEATGAISAISDLVLHTVAEDLGDWDSQQLFPAHARVAVNISPAEFNRRDFLERLGATLDSSGLDPQRLELEITESLLVDDLRTAAERLRHLDRRGVRVALDDFGTGYSSLSYLHQLPLHTLKIDRRFVGDVHDDRSGTITRTIVALAHHLGVVAVAEGVENEQQRRFLRDAGCDLAQGFLIAPPLPRVAFDRFLRDLPVAAAPTAS